MFFESEEEIECLLAAFRNRALPKSEWTHEAHLVVALGFVLTEPREDVLARVRDAIRALNEFHGTPNTDDSGYHETLTVFWLCAVAAFVHDSDPRFSRLELANRMLAANFNSKLPLRHYTRERLFTVEARRTFVGPDVMEFELLV
jgi:hypothetical protein